MWAHEAKRQQPRPEQTLSAVLLMGAWAPGPPAQMQCFPPLCVCVLYASKCRTKEVYRYRDTLFKSGAHWELQS